MLRPILLFFLLSSYTSFAQFDKQINEKLIKKDFHRFRIFVENYKSENRLHSISSGNIREITTGFSEAIFYFSKSYPVLNGVSISVNSKIRILTKENLIIYYLFEAKEIVGLPKKADTVIDTVYSYSNYVQIDAMRKKFREEYGETLNEKELFIDSIYFGDACGHHAEPTKEEKLLINWVRGINTDSLNQWLLSPNTEKQVYAVKGFYALNKKGISIDQNTLKLIRRVKGKKGTIKTCGHCDSGFSPISLVLQEFIFL